MVEEQLTRRGIADERVLAAMRKVPRHLFVEEALRDRAYGDHPLPIGDATSQILTLVENAAGQMKTTAYGECSFVKLVGKYAWDA